MMTIEEAIKRANAKLQCIDRESSGLDEMCNKYKCYDCELNYEQGNIGQQKEWLRLAITALKKENQADSMMAVATIKDTIIKAGRFEEIMSEVNQLYSVADGFPIRAHADYNGNLIYYVSSDKVKEGLKTWEEQINYSGDGDKPEDVRIKLINLQLVIDNIIQITLNNYVHSSTPSEDILERLRTYLIFNSSINAILSPSHDVSTGEFKAWTIPQCWHK